MRDNRCTLGRTSPTLPYILYTLGSGSLRKYARLIREWFGLGLSDYDFYILLLGFAYPFRSMSVADLATEPEAVALLLHGIAADQATYSGNEDDFYFFERQLMQSIRQRRSSGWGNAINHALDTKRGQDVCPA